MGNLDLRAPAAPHLPLSRRPVIKAQLLPADGPGNPPKLRTLSNFSESWGCAVSGPACADSIGFPDDGTSVQQSGSGGCEVAYKPFCRSFHRAEGWAAAA
jgi:hypothetical protein